MFCFYVGSWSSNAINFSLVPSSFSSLSKSLMYTKTFFQTDGLVCFFNFSAGDLAFQVLFGPFSEEQRDIIMEVLTGMFCYKHSKVTIIEGFASWLFS